MSGPVFVGPYKRPSPAGAAAKAQRRKAAAIDLPLAEVEDGSVVAYSLDEVLTILSRRVARSGGLADYAHANQMPAPTLAAVLDRSHRPSAKVLATVGMAARLVYVDVDGVLDLDEIDDEL